MTPKSSYHRTTAVPPRPEINPKVPADGKEVPTRPVKTWAKVLSAVVVALLIAWAAAAFLGGPSVTPIERAKAESKSVLEAYADNEGGVRGTGPGFSAMFPGTPEKDSSVLKVEGAELTVNTLADEAGDAVFMVQYIDYPPDLVDFSLPRFILRTAAEDGATAVQGELKHFKQTTIDGDPGAAVLISNGGFENRGRLILHGYRLYIVQVISSEVNTPGFTRFIESLKLD